MAETTRASAIHINLFENATHPVVPHVHSPIGFVDTREPTDGVRHSSNEWRIIRMCVVFELDGFTRIDRPSNCGLLTCRHNRAQQFTPNDSSKTIRCAPNPWLWLQQRVELPKSPQAIRQ